MSLATSFACKLGTSGRWKHDRCSRLHWAVSDGYSTNLVDYSIQSALQQLVCRQKIKDTDHLKQVLNRHEQSMLLLTSGLNDCCWSFVLRVDTLSIVFVSSVMFACRKRFLCHMTALKMWRVLTFSEYFIYQLPYKEYIITLFKSCSVLCYQLISEHSGVNCVTLLLTIATWRCIKSCAFFLDHSVFYACILILSWFCNT